MINAYRAWLLQQNGQTQPARARLQEALDHCLDPERGPTLHWIGLVLHTLGQSLGLGSRSACSQRVQQLRPQLSTLLPAAPHAALAAFATAASAAHPNQPLPVAEIEAHLRQCLPFNFR